MVDGELLSLDPGSRAKRNWVGFGGGKYVKFLSDDTRDVATDLARFLTRWAQGGDLTEED